MVCDDLLREDTRLYICDDCYKKLPRYGGGFHRIPELPWAEGIFAAFRYTEGIDTSIHSLKYGHQPGLSRTMGLLIYEQISKEKIIPDFDMIIPVPMHPRKKRQRGYNQSELVGKELSVLLNVPLRCDVLMKTRYTKPQSTLKREKRLQNMTDAFKLKNESDIKGKNILLVDDVVTTGTTLNACAKILTENGATFVFATVIAIAEK
jgi:ComF family protein